MEDDPDLDINAPCMGSMPALHVAAEKGYSACAHILISAGVKLNEKDQFGNTALITAVASSSHQVVEKLLRANCDVALTNHGGNSALHVACKNSQQGTHIVRLLLKASCPVNTRNGVGESPLSIAVQSGGSDIVRELLFTSRYLNVNETLAGTPNCDKIMKNTLDSGLFRLAYYLWVSGYKCNLAIRDYFKEKKRSMPTCKKENFFFKCLLTHGKNPLSLQNLCRNTVRENLDNFRNVYVIGLPVKLCEYVLFQDVYEKG